MMQEAPLSIATGVELAAELVQLTEDAIGYGAQGLAARVTITLIEAGPRLLAAFPPRVSTVTQERLEELGVKVMTNTRVTAAKADGFELDGIGHFHASLSVWAAGIKTPNFLADLDGLEATRGNQFVVNSALQTSRDPNI